MVHALSCYNLPNLCYIQWKSRQNRLKTVWQITKVHKRSFSIPYSLSNHVHYVVFQVNLPTRTAVQRSWPSRKFPYLTCKQPTPSWILATGQKIIKVDLKRQAKLTGPMYKRCYRNDIYPLYLLFKWKISLIFMIFPVFFPIFRQNPWCNDHNLIVPVLRERKYPKTHCEADLAWRFFCLPSAMSFLAITA